MRSHTRKACSLQAKYRPARTDEYSVPFQEAMERLEKKYIENALSAASDNKTEAARLPGISVRVLHYKEKKYQL